MQEGKILHWGISEMPADYLRRAHKVCPVTAVENRYNVINREQENHIGWVAHGPMFKGLLSGTFQKGARFARDDWRSSSINDENLDRLGYQLQYLGALGEEKHATAGQLSLAWILHRKPYIVPIPGMRSVQRLEENAKALEITLSPEEMEKIDALLDAAAQN